MSHLEFAICYFTLAIYYVIVYNIHLNSQEEYILTIDITSSKFVKEMLTSFKNQNNILKNKLKLTSN